MKTLPMLLVAGLLALSGCGNDDTSASKPAEQDDAAMKKAAYTPQDAAAKRNSSPAKKGTGTTVTLADSQFGRMLVDSRKQAIYIFENDRKGKTVCYGKCAKAWPPVFTKGKPRAAKGVRASLLGTVRRRDGKLQVTYAGKPLYFYAHEDPGVVLCHNVNLNGGLWWVIGPNGKRRP